MMSNMFNRSILDKSKMFDYNFPTSWKRHPKCGKCLAEYCLNVRKKYNRAMLLKCGHSICENCCHRVGPIKCPECGEHTTIDKDRYFKEALEFNFYMLGWLNYKEHGLLYDISRAKPPMLEGMPDGDHECSECNQEFTKFFCVQCSVPYCKKCFETVHKVGKALQKHCLSILGGNRIAGMDDKPKRCYKHKKNCFSFCTDCSKVCCSVCIQEYHSDHRTTMIVIQNQNLIPQICSLLETLKLAQSYAKQSQKDAKFIERKQEDHAAEVINNISKHFSYLHGVLQNAETKLLHHVKEHSQGLIKRTRQIGSLMKKSNSDLEAVSAGLENFIKKCPSNIYLGNIIGKVNNLLESGPCNVAFDKMDKNPFEFVELKPCLADLESCHQLNVADDADVVKIMTFFGDLSLGDETSHQQENDIENIFLKSLHKTASINSKSGSGSIVDEEINTKKTNKAVATVEKPKTAAITIFKSNTNLQKRLNCQKVHVSHIRSPHQFYIQYQNFLTVSDDFNKLCAQEAEYAATPSYIELDHMYLVLNASNKTWYRGIVEAPAGDDQMYKVRLIDYGNCINLPKQRFRSVSEDLESRPRGAIECRLYAVNPIGDNWLDSAAHLMSEILQNNLLTMIIIEKGPPLVVDLLTTHLKYMTSIRDALIYTNIGAEEEIIDPEIIDKANSIAELKKNAQFTGAQRYYKNVFKENESFRGIVMNIVSPQEFYIAKFDHKNNIDSLYEELNEVYKNPHEKIFSPQPTIVCAVNIDGSWYRARISKVLPKIKCIVWLVDYGKYETVDWKQLRILDDKFSAANELVVQCCLMDVEPLQENDYTWTEEAIIQFKRLSQSNFIQVNILRSKDFRYKVGLYIIQKNVDLNINACLVNLKHAISTGSESLCLEYPKNLDCEKISELDESMVSVQPEQCDSTKKRTKIKVSYVVSPGEFYVYLAKCVAGMHTMHQLIQQEQSKNNGSQDAEEQREWKEGDKCLVHVTLKDELSVQWYRGRITSIETTAADDESIKYTVYLCDHGRTFTDISSPNIAICGEYYIRVADSVVRCHMACVQPTGGIKDWSASSIDEFKRMISKFEALGASMQGKRTDNSLPITVWGMTTEYTDPLSPTIYRWRNINKILVNSGLAHLIEKFTPVMECDNIIEEEMGNSEEQSLEHWLQMVMQNVDNKTPTPPTEQEKSFEEEVDVDNSDGTIPVKWLPPVPITKSIFTAIPTYIDTDGVVYLHDTMQKEMLTHIRHQLNKDVSNDDDLPKQLSWYRGQPCLAKFHVDNQFYRAEVIEPKSDQIITVRFIDYGNIEECSIEDLRKNVKMTNIPTQATTYCLAGIMPKNNAPKWPTDALDFIHASIVEKTCGIRIETFQERAKHKMCYIKIEGTDISELLIRTGYADKRSRRKNFNKSMQKNSPPIKIANPKIDPIELIFPDHQARAPSKEKTTGWDNDEYRKLFRKIELDKLYNSISIKDDDEISEVEANEFVKTYQSNMWNEDFYSDPDVVILNSDDDEILLNVDNDEEDDDDDDEEAVANKSRPAMDFDFTNSTIQSFNPIETSTVKSEPFKESNVFFTTKLPLTTNEFYCEVTYIRNPLNIFVYPHIPDHKREQNDLERKIQLYAKGARPLTSVESDTPCLAVYHEDGLWYRGMVRSFSHQTQMVEVIFVDYFNIETVKLNQIKACPDSLFKYPLRNIQVKLNNLKQNPRWRDNDIQRKLGEVLVNRKIFVKICRHSSIPEVQLYSSESDKNLIYQGLIAEKFYICKNKQT